MGELKVAGYQEKKQKNLSAAWGSFITKLATVLRELAEDQILVISAKKSAEDVVQFIGQGSWGIRIEVISNFFRPDQNQLTEAQISCLIELGWNCPSGSAQEATPALQPNGSPNFCLDIPIPVNFIELAETAICTLSKVFGVGHPGQLQYQSFAEFGNSIALPKLGLKIAIDEPLGKDALNSLYKLEQWRDRALTGIDTGLKERENDPVERQLDDANRRIGELVMEVEILQKERRAKRPLVGRRSSR